MPHQPEGEVVYLPGAMLPLKVLIFGVPFHRPDVRALMSCPISGPASVEPGDCSSGPEGTLPPPGKVTSWSSSSDTPLPNRCAQSLRGGMLGVQLICTAKSPVRDP